MKIRALSSNSAQAPLQIIIVLLPFLVAVGFIVWGVVTIQTGCTGLGLIGIGIGFAIGGWGGSAVVRHPFLYLAGSGGVVVLIIGVGIRIAIGC